MRVLEVISDTNIGGAGILLLTRLRHSDKKRFQTTVLLPSGSLLAPRFRAIGVPVRVMHGCHDRSTDLRHIGELVRIIRDIKPDLINCHGCFSARVAASIARVPIRIYTRHCAYPVSRLRRSLPAKAVFGFVSCAVSHHAIAVADAARENLTAMGMNPSRITVVINGAEDLQRLTEEEKRAWKIKLGIPEASTVVGISARLESCKDHACLLRAAERLHKERENCFFLIVGDGSLRSDLEQDAERRGLKACTRFVGFVEDVAPYINLMDIHINCSIGTETSSLAISEAMSLGIPTVASDFGGNPYMVRDGENGFLYPAGNDEALAEKIRILASSPKLYEQVSRGARERFLQELNASQMTKKTEQLYARLSRERLGHWVTDQADS